MSKLKVNEIEPFSSTGVAIGGPPTANPSAILDVQSTSQGMFAPRMTTVQRNAIVSPGEGLLIYNLDDGRLEQYTAGQWTVAGNGLSPIKNVLRVTKNTVLNSGDFSSINAALASITDASPTNTYSIEVGPGVFTELAIHTKPYVYIQGIDYDATIIQAADPTDHLVYGADFSSISKCLLTGVTQAGKSLVFYQSTTGTLQTTFWVDNCRFGSSDTLAIADGTISHSNLFVLNCRFGSVYQFNTGFVARTNSGPYFGRVAIQNTITSKMTAPYPQDCFVCDGVNSEIVLKSVTCRTGAPGAGGNGIRVRNGGTVRTIGVDIAGFSKGMWVENVGPIPPVLFLGIVTFASNTLDIKVDNPNTQGGITAGITNDTTVDFVNGLTNLGYILLGADTGDVIVSGDVKQTQPDGVFTDTTTLGAAGAPMGVYENGDINPPVSGFTILLEAGRGYLQKSDGSLRKITWPATSLTLPPNATSYIYFDENAVAQVSPSIPNLTQNILLGRAVTHSTGIELIEESGFQATHMANALSNALRNGIGVAYSSGSIVSEAGTRNLAITAGSYYLGELNFLAQGANPAIWTSFYQDGVGGFTRVPSQTVVDNAFWDNGTGTLVPIGAGNFAKHAIYALGDSTNDFDSEAYFLVYSQAQYTALTLAEQGSLPNPPNFLSNAVTLIASVIVQEGNTHIVEVRDERPIIGSGRISNIAASTFHHNLLGLNDFDDHLRYLPVNGSRPMTGNLPMGGNDINNVNTVNAQVVNVVDIPLGDSSTKAPNTKFVDQTALLMALIFG